MSAMSSGGRYSIPGSGRHKLQPSPSHLSFRAASGDTSARDNDMAVVVLSQMDRGARSHRPSVNDCQRHYLNARPTTARFLRAERGNRAMHVIRSEVFTPRARVSQARATQRRRGGPSYFRLRSTAAPAALPADVRARTFLGGFSKAHIAPFDERARLIVVIGLRLTTRTFPLP